MVWGFDEDLMEASE